MADYMVEMSRYSDEFILSQYMYYGKHLLTPVNGQKQVLGLYHQYEAEAKKRVIL